MKESLIDCLVQQQALQFGDFTLKSGKKSHYFFNLGRITQAADLTLIADAIIELLEQHHLSVDCLFGPAYKGIPLATATAVRWFQRHQCNLKLSYSRKEIKDHGEGGQIVGLPWDGNIVIIDDVLTAGTALSESIELIQQHQGKISAAVVVLNREEKAKSGEFAKDYIERYYQVPVYSILTASDVIEKVA